MISTPHQILCGQIKNEMGGACIKYEGKERCIHDFDGEK